ncbi:MAG: glycosyl transferase [Leptolyngbya sp. SIO4C1]|nr:glycosyl transferase [Leptolyngbya sp. SIO4C1]
MKTLIFYCQHILGIGHLVRSLEIARGLMKDFQIYFVNGGEIIDQFPIPPGIEMINLPAIKTDAGFRQLQVPDCFETVDQALEARRQLLLELCDRIRPDVVMVELFPFGRRRFSTELIPFLERARTYGAKVVCSLRDIVVTKQDRARHEAKVCKLLNCYFDQLLIHGDPAFVPLELSFGSVHQLRCAVHYTGYVVKALERNSIPLPVRQPFILVSVGGGRFGHDLLASVALASALLADRMPHQIQIFAGPFSPAPIFEQLRQLAAHQPNLSVNRYTPHLLSYMQQADLSISMGGYNTTLNVLQTGVRAMLLPFKGNDDQEQTLRADRLEQLGLVRVIRPEDLPPERLADCIVEHLQQPPRQRQFDLQGVERTAALVRSLAYSNEVLSA